MEYEVALIRMSVLTRLFISTTVLKTGTKER